MDIFWTFQMWKRQKRIYILWRIKSHGREKSKKKKIACFLSFSWLNKGHDLTLSAQKIEAKRKWIVWLIIKRVVRVKFHSSSRFFFRSIQTFSNAFFQVCCTAIVSWLFHFWKQISRQFFPFQLEKRLKSSSQLKPNTTQRFLCFKSFTIHQKNRKFWGQKQQMFGKCRENIYAWLNYGEDEKIGSSYDVWW